LDCETNEWTTSISKCDIIDENEVNGKQESKHLNGKEQNGEYINDKNDTFADLNADESHNYCNHSKAKVSLNSEPLIEVEESTTAGH
jgi:hypothetical protein